MNSSLIIIFCFFMIHALTYNVQSISSKEYFYGVYVKNIDISDDKRELINKSYKKSINIVFLCLVTIFFVNLFLIKLNKEIIYMLLMFVYISFSFVYLKKYYEQVKSIKDEFLSSNKSNFLTENKKIVVDTEFLNEKSKLQKKFKILFGICMIFSVFSFFYLILNYNNLPNQIITHWSLDGSPDKFVDKNFFNVFFMSFINFSLVFMLCFLSVNTIGSRIYLDTNNLEENRNNALKRLNKIGYLFLLLTLNIQFITTATIINQKSISTFFMSVTLFLTLFVSVLLVYNFIMLSNLKSKNKEINPVDSDDDKWIYGFIYYNEDDSSFIIEKRIGAGWTFNFANIKSKIIGLILVFITISSLFLSLI